MNNQICKGLKECPNDEKTYLRRPSCAQLLATETDGLTFTQIARLNFNIADAIKEMCEYSPVHEALITKGNEVNTLMFDMAEYNRTHGKSIPAVDLTNQIKY